jgi:hypothetical protein
LILSSGRAISIPFAWSEFDFFGFFFADFFFAIFSWKGELVPFLLFALLQRESSVHGRCNFIGGEKHSNLGIKS